MEEFLAVQDPVAVALTAAIRSGDLEGLRRLLAERPGLAAARIGDTGMSRTALHAATDWPGHFPYGPQVVAALIAAGADVNARFAGPHTETPLHWAASSDDVAVLDALLDAGADIEAPGSVVDGGTPLADAVAFGRWNAARRLVERGARQNLWQAAGLGDLGRVRALLDPGPPPDRQEVTGAFWCACHGGRRTTAAYLLERGAELNWIGYDGLTPLQAAQRSRASDVAAWLRERGALTADEVRGAEPGR
ncbi:ankyrin repeat domain-containing protein [Planomonospora venezuelensis]|uniref:Ankyrin repeat protein n=1 Tax=Planomonospora venezuelensis TaxID=1999 RepID=A0A841DE63_PLAVE|nr:ankyrin repeat domain-containing protein [Planomonospora venezuelensis]MBB5967063.1 ankyrin repeat protein [Planomonospora venezuelensis]GIN04903.1 hypothetical protein Pve01_65610 [Planomonospora venezuelensis]